jgi:hypothetical protein
LFGFIKILISYQRYPFRFQTSKISFHWCIISTISTAAHALRDLITPQSLPKLSAGVMRSFV